MIVRLFAFFCELFSNGSQDRSGSLLHTKINDNFTVSMADPVFSIGGCVNLRRGAITYYLPKLLPKSAWKWKKLDQEGNARLQHPRSVSQWVTYQLLWLILKLANQENSIGIHVMWFILLSTKMIFICFITLLNCHRFKPGEFFSKWFYELNDFLSWVSRGFMVVIILV